MSRNNVALIHSSAPLGVVSPQVNLGTNQFLFSVVVSPSEMPCICLRHDVDGLVWQPRPSQPDEMLEHIATFNALGKTFD